MANQSQSPPAPLQQITLTADDLKDPGLLNNQLQNLTQMVNYILGHGGEPPYLKSGANFGGAPAKNIGPPVDPTDAISHYFADNNFGATALRPMFEALGNRTFQTFRQLNSRQQREMYSSFLNDVKNTAPTANTATVSAPPPSGGTVTVTVSSGLHQRVDGSNVPFMSRTDTYTLPATYAISSLVRTSNVVTATIAASPIVPGNYIDIPNAADATFDGNFVVLPGSTSTSLIYAQIGPNASVGGGGFVSLANVYYYTIAVGQNKLGVVESAGADTWSNRIPASVDGTTPVAIIVVNAVGMDLYNSAAGSSAPQSGATVPVIRRI